MGLMSVSFQNLGTVIATEREYGGLLEVDSALGNGTTVRLSLPHDEAEPHDEAGPGDGTEEPREEPTP